MPVSKVTISPEFTELAALVGQALDKWSHVEMELASLFRYLTDIPDQMVAHVAMASIQSFDARVQVCNNLMDVVTTSPLHEAYWKWLYNRLTKLAKKRNEIAHFTIVGWETEWLKDEPTPPEKVLWRVVPYFSLGRMIITRNNHNEGLSAVQLNERTALFHELWGQVAWLRAEIQVLKGKLKANQIPVPDRVQELRDIASQTPTDTPPPPQP